DQADADNDAAHGRIIEEIQLRIAERRRLLKPSLETIYHNFNAPDSATDPIHVVRRFDRDDDREIVAFCASALAFGRVASVLQSIERLVSVMGRRPAAFVRSFDPSSDGVPLRDFVHRWTRGADVIALLWILRQMMERSGSIEGFFLDGDPGGEDV